MSFEAAPGNSYRLSCNRANIKADSNNLKDYKNMKTRAAVAWEAGKSLEIEEIDIDGPKAGEVLLRNVATGICHTDAFTLSGEDPEGGARIAPLCCVQPSNAALPILAPSKVAPRRSQRSNTVPSR